MKKIEICKRSKNKVIKIFCAFIFCIIMISCKTSIILPYHEQKQLLLKYGWQDIRGNDRFKAYVEACSISVDYPHIVGLNNSELENLINQEIKNAFFKVYKNFYYEKGTYIFKLPRSNWIRYEQDSIYKDTHWINYDLYSKSKKIYSLMFKHSSTLFPGGSRTTDYNQEAYNINLKTGEFLNWYNIFEKNKTKQASEIVLKYFNDPSLDEIYEKYNTFPIKGIHFVNNKNSFIVFAYYIEGDILLKVNIPKKELIKLMKKEYRNLW